MPNGRGSGSVTNRELCEELRNEGASGETATTIANAVEQGRHRAVEGPPSPADER
jgi:hypothetical protein